ncbi:hypothetical protein EVJ58_g9235 [Rhodofomes roseus]|uniref:Uncharacterized protein n=1 Tax=Rhodofomes roseus TaxID=34475 RepID=A0A4Y9XWQ6_9APHY|nr:hypothetical protein EVJ58_g9235 [Rhodofomes roseus]
MNAGHRADDILPDLTNHFGSSRSAKAARRKHGSSLARKPTSNAEAGPSGTAGTGLLTPPSSQSQAEMDARRMLISPPPEEFLRRNRTVSVRSRLTSAPAELPHVATSAPKSVKPAAKRKRQISAGTIQETSVFDAGAVSEEGVSSLVDTHVAPEATPNGKPRKQSKRHVSFVARETSPPRPSTSNLAASVTTPTRLSRSRSESPTKRVLFLSPHQTNPRADYIPPSPSRRREFVSAPARRRSVTPVFPYEPPARALHPAARGVLLAPAGVPDALAHPAAQVRAEREGREEAHADDQEGAPGDRPDPAASPTLADG